MAILLQMRELREQQKERTLARKAYQETSATMQAQHEASERTARVQSLNLLVVVARETLERLREPQTVAEDMHARRTDSQELVEPYTSVGSVSLHGLTSAPPRLRPLRLTIASRFRAAGASRNISLTVLRPVLDSVQFESNPLHQNLADPARTRRVLYGSNPFSRAPSSRSFGAGVSF